MLKRSQCNCQCHDPGNVMVHCHPCCQPDPKKFEDVVKDKTVVWLQKCQNTLRRFNLS